MTGFVGIFLALVSGLLLTNRRQLLPAILIPFVLILISQTWGIADGRGVSPPSTVNRFPDLISYYVVQLIIFGLTFGAANQIRLLRIRSTRTAVQPGRNRVRLATLVNCAVCGVAAICFRIDRPVFDPGNVKTHSSQGPPVIGLLGIGLVALTFFGLGLVTLWSARSSRRARTA